MISDNAHNPATAPSDTLSRRFVIAPMMDWSDRHCRFFWRQLTRRALLYTEMVTTGAILHGDTHGLLRYDPREHPLALQVGGSDPVELARCAAVAEQWHYDEINLNCGCPSDRVQSGRFGACLMAEPRLVADCIRAMRDACGIPVTIKHRIGIDDRDSYEQLRDFVGTVSSSGCQTFIVHARKAWLKGLSPKQNRELPPLQYDKVYRLKVDFPQLEIIINGGITNLDTVTSHLQHCDGVMIGRAAYQDPYLLAEVDRRLFGDSHETLRREDVILAMLPYIEEQLQEGARLNHITRHLLGLFNGMPGARRFRRHLSENAHRPGASVETLTEALARLSFNTGQDAEGAAESLLRATQPSATGTDS